MSSVRSEIICIGLSHRTTPMEIRSRFYIQEEPLRLLLPTIRQRFALQELCILSTCNRFEIYLVAARGGLTESLLREVFSAVQTISGHDIEQVTGWHDFLYISSGTDAVRHAFRVACGIESLVIGETQITGQFKDAFSIAREAECLGTSLNRLEQDALSVTKSVRTKTAIGKRSVSVASAAVDLVNIVYSDFRRHAILIIGAGEMSRIIAQSVLKKKPKRLLIANRSQERARALCEEIKTGENFSINELPSLLVEADIVISATSSDQLVITRDMVEQTLSRRGNRSLCLVDIAMPCDIDPQVDTLDGVYHFDIDDLKQVVDRNLEERKQASEEANQIVEAGLTQYLRWLDSLSFKPSLAEFDRYLRELFANERDRTLSKSIFQELSKEQRENIQSMLDSISRKITGDVGSTLRNPDLNYSRAQLVESLMQLFGIEIDDKTMAKDSSDEQKSS